MQNELEKSCIIMGHYLLIKLSLKSEQVQFNNSRTSVLGVDGQAPRFKQLLSCSTQLSMRECSGLVVECLTLD